MKIRRYHGDDLPRVMELFQGTVKAVNVRDYDDAAIAVWSTIESPQKWQDRLTESFTVVAEVDGSLVGFASLTADGLVDFLYVHKHCQRLGVGTRLVKELELEARAQSIHILETEASITAYPFFMDQGYKVLKQQTKEHRGAMFVNFVMMKQL